MFEILIVGLIVTAFVLGLFRLVQWIASFFPALNSPRFNPPVTRWFIILFLFSAWLVDAASLSEYGNLTDWKSAQYRDLLHLCGLTYCIVVVWNLKTKNQQSLEVRDETGS